MHESPPAHPIFRYSFRSRHITRSRDMKDDYLTPIRISRDTRIRSRLFYGYVRLRRERPRPEVLRKK